MTRQTDRKQSLRYTRQ